MENAIVMAGGPGRCPRLAGGWSREWHRTHLRSYFFRLSVPVGPTHNLRNNETAF